MVNSVPQPQEPKTTHRWRAGLARMSRALIWTVIGLILLGAAFSSRTAWAQSVICYEGFSSIPIAPTEIFLRKDGTPVTYTLALCDPPSDPVTVDINPLAAGLVETSPDPLILGEGGQTVPEPVNEPESVNVTVDDNHPEDDPFSVVISHSVSSQDDRYDFGPVNAPTATAYYSPPLAVNDIGIGIEGSSISVNTAANDRDRRNQGLTYTRTSDVDDGEVTLTASGQAFYTPTAGFFGADSFRYAITDAVDNADDARVTLVVLPDSAENGQADRVNPNEEEESNFSSNTGANVRVQYPAGLLGDNLPPDTELIFVFSDKIEPDGDTGNGPGGAGFTGVLFDLIGYLNGEELDSEDLSRLITVRVTMPPGFQRNSANLIVAVWDGTGWSTQGINVTGVNETTIAAQGGSPAAGQAVELTFTTSVLGEFAVFRQNLLYIPAIERASTAAGAGAPQ